MGQQFTWTFFYQTADGKEVASPQLYVPEGRPVKFTVQSRDVLHDFWVPAFRMKIDAVPGIDTSIRVTPNRRGTYPVVCAELCGLGHSTMRQTAHVVEPRRTSPRGWRSSASPRRRPAGGGGTAAPRRTARALFAANGCGGCHTLADAGTQARPGPDLDKVLKGKDAGLHPGVDRRTRRRQIAPGYQGGDHAQRTSARASRPTSSRRWSTTFHR